MHCATLSDLYPGPLLPPMGRCRPTKHHFTIDSSRHDLTAVRTNYRPNGNGLEDKRRPERFAEVADILMYMILNEGIDSQRIDLFFDVYRGNLIKNPKREKRGSKNGHEFRNIKADHKIPVQFRK